MRLSPFWSIGGLYLEFHNCLHDPTINKGTTIDERVKMGEKLYKQ